jgi:hypothetical protein
MTDVLLVSAISATALQPRPQFFFFSFFLGGGEKSSASWFISSDSQSNVLDGQVAHHHQKTSFSLTFSRPTQSEPVPSQQQKSEQFKLSDVGRVQSNPIDTSPVPLSDSDCFSAAAEHL